MGFLQDLVDQLPGATTEKNPLMGGQTLSDLYSNTHTGNASDNGFAAIYATDPTIQLQRMINGVDRSTGGSGNIFSDKSMQEEAGIANTIGKILAADWAGGVAGESAGEASAASGSSASTAQQVSNVAQGATTGGTLAGMNNQSIGEGAVVGGILGAIAPTKAPETNTDPTAITQTASGAGETQSAVNSLTVAERGALRGAAQAGVNAGKNDQSVGEAMVAGALTGAISGQTNATMSPEIAGMVNGAINSAIQADRAGQPIENGLFYGAATGLAGGAAGNAVYQETGSNQIAGAAAGAARDAAGLIAQNNLPVSPTQRIEPPDPQFEAYMKQMTKGYTPQVSEVINPIILAAAGNGLTVEQTETTQLNNSGISPLLTQGA